jgi:DNA-binding response OmpR family regulator
MPAIQIWLVDDNEQIRSLVADGLKGFEGIRCARDFDSPNAVLSALASKPGPDLILLDIQMGDQNGLDAVRPIRSLSRATRVVMFTTSYSAERKRRAMEDGASDFLLKLDPLEDVVARIRELAREPAPRVPRRRAPAAQCSDSLVERRRRRSWLGFSRSNAVPVVTQSNSPRPSTRLNRYLDLLRGIRSRKQTKLSGF